MSTATFGLPSTTSTETHAGWRRILVPIGVVLAVFTPLAMWLRRRRNHSVTGSN